MLKRSSEVKEVVHVKAKKYDGQLNPQCKTFALDPHVTRYEDLRKILQGAFTIADFHISYLCRDDAGENIYLSMLTEWDLDAAFMTSSDPYLRLKIEVDPFSSTNLNHINKKCHSALTFSNQKASPSKTYKIVNVIENSFNISEALQVSKTWMSSIVTSINKGKVLPYGEADASSKFFPAKSPLDDADFRKFLDHKGRLLNPDDLWLRIYYSGIQPSLRKVVWRVLLNVFPSNLTGEQRIQYMKLKSREYTLLKDTWKQNLKEDWVSQVSSMVWKDVLRTDRTQSYFSGPDNSPNMSALHNILLTYALTHKDTSYCQGMSDIASPILFVMDNEAHAYICFCSLMQRLRNNFLDDGTVMSIKFKHLALLVKYHDTAFYEYLKGLSADNMYFCYRWLLLEMKREFSFENALTVLEVMWSSLPPQPPDANGLYLGSYNFDNLNKSTPLSLCAKSLTQLSVAKTDDTIYNTKNSQQSVTRQSSVSYINCKNSSQTIATEKQGDQIPSGIWTCEENGDHKMEFKEAIFNVNDQQNPESIELPSPEVLGCGNPFLMFVCLSLLLNEKETLLSTKFEYDDLVMHFDKLVRKHDTSKVLSKAMSLFAAYLKVCTTENSNQNQLNEDQYQVNCPA